MTCFYEDFYKRIVSLDGFKIEDPIDRKMFFCTLFDIESGWNVISASDEHLLLKHETKKINAQFSKSTLNKNTFEIIVSSIIEKESKKELEDEKEKMFEILNQSFSCLFDKRDDVFILKGGNEFKTGISDRIDIRGNPTPMCFGRYIYGRTINLDFLKIMTMIIFYLEGIKIFKENMSYELFNHIYTQHQDILKCTIDFNKLMPASIDTLLEIEKLITFENNDLTNESKELLALHYSF